MQPAMNSDKGVILTIGLNIAGDWAALVIPIATPSDVVNPITMCNDAVSACKQTLLGLLQGLMAANCHVRFVAAEGMDDGKIPERADYISSAYPGTVTGGCLEASVGGIVAFYEEPSDILPGERLRHSRSIVPGLPQSMVTLGGQTNDTWAAAAEAWAASLIQGFAGDTPLTATWYRVLAAPPRSGAGHAPATPLRRLAANTVARTYIGTQRRRTLPR